VGGQRPKIRPPSWSILRPWRGILDDGAGAMTPILGPGDRGSRGVECDDEDRNNENAEPGSDDG
jgi:hypothetical protein